MDDRVHMAISDDTVCVRIPMMENKNNETTMLKTENIFFTIVISIVHHSIGFFIVVPIFYNYCFVLLSSFFFLYYTISHRLNVFAHDKQAGEIMMLKARNNNDKEESKPRW